MIPTLSAVEIIKEFSKHDTNLVDSQLRDRETGDVKSFAGVLCLTEIMRRSKLTRIAHPLFPKPENQTAIGLINATKFDYSGVNLLNLFYRSLSGRTRPNSRTPPLEV